MYKVSELVGKPLVLLKNARFLGTISSVFFDNKLKTAKCISVIDEDFNTFFLSINSISCLDFDVAICKNLFFVNAKKSACDNSTLSKQRDCICEYSLPNEQNFCQKSSADFASFWRLLHRFFIPGGIFAAHEPVMQLFPLSLFFRYVTPVAVSMIGHVAALWTGLCILTKKREESQ